MTVVDWLIVIIVVGGIVMIIIYCNILSLFIVIIIYICLAYCLAHSRHQANILLTLIEHS